MSMDTEEMVKAQPVDSVVLIGGQHARSNPTAIRLTLGDRVRQNDTCTTHGWHFGQQTYSAAGDRSNDARLT